MYKQGQAGVTKATVSITFDNTDKKYSPVGYDHCEEITITRQVRPSHFWALPFAPSSVSRLPLLQVVIGGRNKYLINGQVAQPT